MWNQWNLRCYIGPKLMGKKRAPHCLAFVCMVAERLVLWLARFSGETGWVLELLRLEASCQELGSGRHLKTLELIRSWPQLVKRDAT